VRNRSGGSDLDMGDGGCGGSEGWVEGRGLRERGGASVWGRWTFGFWQGVQSPASSS